MLIHTNDDLCKSGSNARRAGNLLTKKDDRIAKVSRVEWPFCCIASFFVCSRQRAKLGYWADPCNFVQRDSGAAASAGIAGTF
jgi:hypothetical protein